MNIKTILAGALLGMSVIACGPAQPPEPEADLSTTIVFVHGAWGGGWQYHKVEPLLEEAGYTVYRPTMTGLGERVHLANPEIDLSTHIEDIVKVLEFEDLSDIVLVGHSYGGMVIAGVAERVPQRIAQMVYFDAFVPEDGEAVMDLVGDRLNQPVASGADGGEPWQVVPSWVEEGKKPPVDVPHPLATFTESIALGNPDVEFISTTFLLTVEAGKDSDAFDAMADRARSRGWPVITMEGGHNPYWFQPEAFVDVLLEIVDLAPGGVPMTGPSYSD